MTDVVIRDLAGMPDFLAAEALQSTVWGQSDKVDPADLMMVIAAEGGLAAGAFRGTAMLGYVFGFPTVTAGVQHSHRLATIPDARGLGLGVALKWYQREWCLARGINHVRWTFDPLRLVNANLNIARLGGTVATYYPDYYGAMEGINKGVPSDRLLVDWHLTAPKVLARLAGHAPVIDPMCLRVAVDPRFEHMLSTAPAKAVALRLHQRDALLQHFGDGYRITDYDAATQSYCLTRHDDTDPARPTAAS